MKLSICNEMFEDWKIEDVFECAAEIGYEAVEIAPFTLCESVADISKDERDKIRKASDEFNIEVAGLHWLLVSPKGLYVNHPDSEIREKTKEYFMELIKFCSELDGRIMVIGSPKERNVVESLTFQQAWDYAKETFSESAKYAQELDIVLCMEPLSSDQTNFINLPEEAVKMIEEVDNPNFELILDVYSSSKEDVDIPSTIRKHAEHLAHFHSNDDNGYLPGSGSVDYPSIISALKETNYSGYLSTEVFNFEPDPVTIARKSYNFLSSLLYGLFQDTCLL